MLGLLAKALMRTPASDRGIPGVNTQSSWLPLVVHADLGKLQQWFRPLGSYQAPGRSGLRSWLPHISPGPGAWGGNWWMGALSCYLYPSLKLSYKNQRYRERDDVPLKTSLLSYFYKGDWLTWSLDSLSTRLQSWISNKGIWLEHEE